MEPLAGISGALVGSFIGAFSTYFFIVWPLWTGVVLGGLAVVIGIIAGLYSHFAGYGPEGVPAYRLSEAVARLIEQLITFWDWLTGPRARIVNPLIRTALDILDRIPVVTAQLAAFAAIFFTRILPWLSRLINLIPGYVNLIGSVIDLVKWAIHDLIDRLMALPGMIKGTVLHLKTLLLNLVDVLGDGFKNLANEMAAQVSNVSNAFAQAASEWLADVSAQIRDALETNPLVRFFEESIGILTSVKDVLAAHFPWIAGQLSSFLAGEGIMSKLQKWAIREIVPDAEQVRAEAERLVGPQPVPGLWDEWFYLRSQGILPDIATFLSPYGQSEADGQSGELESMFSIGSDLSRTIREGLAARPVDMFAGEWARLRRGVGGNPREVLVQLHDDDVNHYRALIGSLLDRMMPAAASGYFARLEDLLEPLSNGAPEGPRQVPFPFLDVREEDRLRLEIPRFRVLYRGPLHPDTRELIRSFGQNVRAAWIGQPYHMPAEGSATLVAVG